MEDSINLNALMLLRCVRERNYSEYTKKRIFSHILNSKNPDIVEKKVLEAIADCKTEEEALAAVEKIV